MTLTGTRKALIAAALTSTAFGGLLALEYVAPNAAAPPTAVITNVENSSNGNHVRHCTDAKGSDAQKNKHCREVSGAQ